MQAIRVEPQIQTNPIQLSKHCWVEVRLINQGAASVLINRRLSVGYRDSLDRELFAEIFRRGENEVVSKEALLYQRDSSTPQDYVWLEPGQTVSTSFDLFEWYTLPGSGEYDLIVSYQGDRSIRFKPDNLLTGIYSSDRVPFVVTA